MNLKGLQIFVLFLMVIALFVLILKYEVAEALQPEAQIPGVCEVYPFPSREREVCHMVQGAPCMALWGMFLMSTNESKDIQQIIAKKYVTRGCLYGAY